MGNAAIKYDYDFQYDPRIFNEVYRPYISDGAARSTEIDYGGSSSGKSNFVAHRAIVNMLEGGHNYLCVRKVSNSITKSVYNELMKAISELKVVGLFHCVQGLITCINGYQILFSGMDDPEKIKSITPALGVITDVWYEEATEAAKTDIKQLRKRLRGIARYFGKEVIKRIILTFNPIYRTHWIVKEYFTPVAWKDDQKIYEDENIRILKTTYLDNRFLTEQDKAELENETDKYWHDVYTLGNWGVLGNSILTNWSSADLTDSIPTFDKIRNGLDFGYSNDPNSYVGLNVDKKKKKIYIFRGWECRGLTNPKIATDLKASGIGKEVLFCDSAEPKSIQELIDEGINAKATKKGKDSILNGIKWLQGYEIIVDSKLQHIINELTIWSWMKDKYGENLDIPEDKNNHAIDALRYATEIDHSGFFGGLV